MPRAFPRTTSAALAALALGLSLSACGGGPSENDEAVCAAANTPDQGDNEAALAVYGAPKADDDEIRTQQDRIKLGSPAESDNDAIEKIKDLCD